MHRRLLITSLVIAVLFSDFGFASAAVMSSGSYKVQIDSINIGGGRGTSASYRLEGTQGETGTGRTTAASNYLYAGFLLPVVAVTPSPTPAAPGVSSAGTRRIQEAFPNAENFQAIGGDRQVQLLWNNPFDIDFQGVRIVRSQEFYPADPSDGVPIYSGPGESFLDTGLENDQPYYYTAFAYDQFGNFASGAVAFAIPFAPELAPPTPPTPPEIPTVPPELIPETLKDLSLEDFDFIQEGVKLSMKEGKVEVKPDVPLTIAIDYDKLPEVLKTILATMQNEKGEVFSFLLRVDEGKERYLATMNPPASGLYPVSFTVVDYKNQGLKKVEGEFEITEVAGGAVSPERPEGVEGPEMLLFLAIALLFLAVVAYLYRRMSKSNFQWNSK